MRLVIQISLLLLLLLQACAGPFPDDPSGTLSPADQERAEPFLSLKNLGYSIQVGAFSRMENAVRLEQSLRQQGIDAFYFRHPSNLYKVRFGDHGTYAAAREEAKSLQERGIIGAFFIVRPQDYPASAVVKGHSDELRRELVATARRFLGAPYCWGGESAESGFDCSGLTMVTYRLNGLNLPRNSRSQFKAGRWVAKKDLQPGDLVFFATKGGTRVTHVGMYVGGGNFIHAPRTGKNVQVERMANTFFARTYMGGRTYL